jgi:hypothetical protein
VGLAVVEVDRPNRQERARRGKSDPLDAVEAARAAQSGRALGAAKTRDGNVEAIRALVVARRSAREARVKTLNQIRHLVVTGPDELRERFRDVPRWRLAEALPYSGGETAPKRSCSPPRPRSPSSGAAPSPWARKASSSTR